MGALRTLTAAMALTVSAASATIVPTSSATAATTYIWNQGWDDAGNSIPGSDHRSWDNAKNWSPQGVPGPGDSVVLEQAPFQGATTLTVPEGMVLDSFVVRGSTTGNVYLQGAPLRVTGSFDWTGGQIGIPIEVAGTGRLAAGQVKSLAYLAGRVGMLKVTGSLLLDDIGTADDQRLTTTPDAQGDEDGIYVAPGGELRTEGTNLVAGTNCCVDPARVVIDGTLHVGTGTTTVRAAELGLHGTTRIVPDATLVSTVGPVRLGDGARYIGGGTLDFTATAAVVTNPAQERVPGGILMEGMGELADGTRIHLGPAAKLTGVGGFDGPGTLDVSAPAGSGSQGAVIHADLTTGAATRLRLGGGVPSRLEAWKADLPGYQGVLRVEGEAELAAGSAFVTQARTRTVIARGGSLRLEPRTTWGNGDCCLAPARLTNDGTLTVAAGAGADPKVVRVDLRTTGVLSVAAGRQLRTEDQPVRLGGTLQVSGGGAPDKERAVVTGQKIIGSFACVRPSGQVATYTATRVSVTGVIGSLTGCPPRGKPVSLGTKKVAKKSSARFTATKGVSTKATKVLVAVTVVKAKGVVKIAVDGAPAFTVGKGTTTRYVVAKRVKKKFVVVGNGGKKPITVKVTMLGAA
ncbi:hypothetical protein [Nocardioides daejeonensis]|uniref:hypothetical protein n=1 Tax=Nocardioides daejeonensis TaxID=1046556 RepID=UPI000D74E422|nr:hypothetical protein [Nocardioides daejeonensis]